MARARTVQYTVFHAFGAVAIIALSFFPLFADVTDGRSTAGYGSLYDMAARPDGGPAVFGLMVLYLLALFMALAAAWPRFAPLPVAALVLAALGLLMLVMKPGTGNPTPDLSATARVCVFLLLLICAVAVVQVVHTVTAARRPRNMSRY